MNYSTVFTIGRQFGSGGRQVGKRLANELGVPFYDKELVALAAKDSGLSEALFANADEKASSSLFYSLVVGSYPLASGAIGVTEMPLNDQLFLILSKTIKSLPRQGVCDRRQVRRLHPAGSSRFDFRVRSCPDRRQEEAGDRRISGGGSGRGGRLPEKRQETRKFLQLLQ